MESFAYYLSMVGLGNPWSRALFGAAIGFIPVVLKSGICYNEVSEGIYKPKQFSLLATSEIPDSEKTAFPWFIFPVLGALFLALFL